MNINLKVIIQRVEYLRGTAKELKKLYRKNKNSLIQDLQLEIECYCDMIECHTKLLNKKMESGKWSVKIIWELRN